MGGVAMGSLKIFAIVITSLFSLTTCLYGQLYSDYSIYKSNNFKLIASNDGYLCHDSFSEPLLELNKYPGFESLHSYGLMVAITSNTDKRCSAYLQSTGSVWHSQKQSKYIEEVNNMIYDDMNTQIGHKPIGIQVQESIISFEDEPFVIIAYLIKNVNEYKRLDSLYIGLNCDYDVPGDDIKSYADDDICMYDSLNTIAMMYNYDGSGVTLGLQNMEAKNAIYGCWCKENEPQDDNDQIKFLRGMSGFDDGFPDDWKLLVANGPYTLEAGENIVLAFAMICASNPKSIVGLGYAATNAWKETNSSTIFGFSSVQSFPNNDNVLSSYNDLKFEPPKFYPNPFNSRIEISFVLKTPSDVKADIYNIIGQKVAVIADRYYNIGAHIINWNTDYLASGTYFMRVRIAENGYTKVKKVVLVR